MCSLVAYVDRKPKISSQQVAQINITPKSPLADFSVDKIINM